MNQKIKFVDKDLTGRIPKYTVTLKDENCPKCGSKHNTVNNQSIREFMDVGEDGNYRIVAVKIIHYKCKDCNKIWQTFPVGMKNSYTSEFRDKVVSDFLYTDKSVQDIAEESLFEAQLIRGIIDDYKNEWDGKKFYRLSSDIGIAKIEKDSEIYYALTDVLAMTVLDILKEEQFTSLDTRGVRNVYLTDIDTPKNILDQFGDVHIIHLEKSIGNSLAKALVKDLRNVKDDAVQEAIELIRNGQTYPFEFLRKYPVFAPYFFAFEKALESIKNKKPLEQLPGLENYNQFADQLEGCNLSYTYESLKDKYLDPYLKGIQKYVDEAENLTNKYNGENLLFAKLLYSGDVNPGLKLEGSDEILYNFGKRI